MSTPKLGLLLLVYSHKNSCVDVVVKTFQIFETKMQRIFANGCLLLCDG